MNLPFVPNKSSSQNQQQYQQPIQHTRQDIYNIPPPAQSNSSLLERLAIEDLKALQISIVKMFSGYQIGSRTSQSADTSRVLKRFQSKKDDWVPIFPLSIVPSCFICGRLNLSNTDIHLAAWDEENKAHKLLSKDHEPIPRSSDDDRYQDGFYPTIGRMPLNHAIYVAEYVMNLLNPTSGTTWFDPVTTNTVEIARLLALNVVFLVDSPLYEYTGNEADLSSFGGFLVKELHGLLNRSLGGFFIDALTKARTEISKEDINSEGPRQTKGRESNTDKFLRNLK